MIGTFKAKYKKYFKGKIRCNAKSKFMLTSGAFGLKALQSCRITAQQMESVRRVISRTVKKLKVKCRTNIYPDYPVTKKPTDVRMGKGKGNVEFWVARVKAGTIMFEVDEVDDEDIPVIKEALRKASAKLPTKCRLVTIDNFLR